MRPILVSIALCLSALGQNAPQTVPEEPDNPALPRILLVGDSISIGYTPYVKKMLAGKANVHRNPGNAGTSGNGVYSMEVWFGKSKWDIIHFNFGLHDLKRMSDGKQQVAPEQYERYLRLFIERAKQTGAKLIFATTTPVPNEKVTPPRVPADVVAYNEIARRVMHDNGIPIDDLYTLMLPHLAEWQQPANVHFKPEGYEALAGWVVKAVQ